jgi:hypothetical protein
MRTTDAKAPTRRPIRGSRSGAVEALWQAWRIPWHQELALARLTVQRAAQSLVGPAAVSVAGPWLTGIVSALVMAEA